jgi:hypothetical protein
MKLKMHIAVTESNHNINDDFCKGWTLIDVDFTKS